ncbi:hypothetical protein EYZ11_007075 [Aspergillus tanneri]|uniref:Aflatoxin regulatory protein domain-containing protein n=1 Tax=Aspergillus tanneri TaxID=1220188 RepID=A0A4S3JDW5_9EURO|nr:hypothetical protein EYZ11_007075 [Aspergillus tanneri]
MMASTGGLTSASPNSQLANDLDFAPDLLSPANHTTVSTPAVLNAQLDDFLASPMCFSMLDPSDVNGLSDSTMINTTDGYNFLNSGGMSLHGLSDNALTTLEQSLGDFSSFKPQSPPNSRPPTVEEFPPQNTPCSCLTQALGLLKQLFPPGVGCCQPPKKPVREHGLHPLPTNQSVISNNRKTIDTISNMLQCSCSQDGYLLSLMSLIVFKVMAWYAAASRRPVLLNDRSPILNGSSHQHREHSEEVQHTPGLGGSDTADDEDQGRMAAQLVLSELHRVQQLVNTLSQHLKAKGTREQFAVDLRQRLRALSAEIVDILRHR